MADCEEWNQKAQRSSHDLTVSYVRVEKLAADCGPKQGPREHLIY